MATLSQSELSVLRALADERRADSIDGLPAELGMPEATVVALLGKLQDHAPPLAALEMDQGAGRLRWKTTSAGREVAANSDGSVGAGSA